MRRIVTLTALAATTAIVGVAVATSASGHSGPDAAPAAAGAKKSPLASDVLTARAATAKYAMNLPRAKAAGYGIITRMIPNMGWHYMNPDVKDFDLRKPPILVYERHGGTSQLAALEWVFTSKPAKPPLPGATYGSFRAACHYMDGTFVPETSESRCAAKSPKTGAAFNFWHPRLVTLHFWIWYPNPSGLYMSMNPLAAPFNHG